MLRLYSLDGTLRANLVGHAGEIKTVAVSADSRWAVSGAADQTLKLWSLAQVSASGTVDLQPTLTLFPALDGEWVAWTPEGFFAASNNGQGLQVQMRNIRQKEGATCGGSRWPRGSTD